MTLRKTTQAESRHGQSLGKGQRRPHWQQVKQHKRQKRQPTHWRWHARHSLCQEREEKRQQRWNKYIEKEAEAARLNEEAADAAKKATAAAAAAAAPCPLVGVIVPKLASAAIDLGKSALKEEAKKYEDSFVGIGGCERLYLFEKGPDSLNQGCAYDIIEVKRRTAQGDDAFTFRAAIFYSEKSQGFYLVPIQFQIKRAKAKVLNTTSSFWNYLTRIPFLYGLLLNSENRVDSTVSLVFEGFVVPKEKEEKESDTRATAESKAPESKAPVDYWPKLGSVEFKVPGYDISENKFLRYFDHSIARTSSRWIVGPSGGGALTITATVYEKDTSNAAKFVNRLDESIDKDAIIAALKKELEKKSGK